MPYKGETVHRICIERCTETFYKKLLFLPPTKQTESLAFKILSFLIYTSRTEQKKKNGSVFVEVEFGYELFHILVSSTVTIQFIII